MIRSLAWLTELCALLLRWILGVAVAVLLASVVIQVVGRYIFSSTPPWTAPLSGVLLAWLSFLGAALAIKTDENLQVFLLPDTLPSQAQRVLVIVIAVASGLFACLLLVAGIEQVKLTMLSRVLGLNVSSMWLYLCAPVSGAFMLIFLIERVIRALAGDRSEES